MCALVNVENEHWENNEHDEHGDHTNIQTSPSYFTYDQFLNNIKNELQNVVRNEMCQKIIDISINLDISIDMSRFFQKISIDHSIEMLEVVKEFSTYPKQP